MPLRRTLGLFSTFVIVRSQNVSILASVIGTLVLALILVQLFWLQSEFEANRKAIDLRVAKSMQSMAAEIGASQYCAPSYSKAFVEPGERVFLMLEKRNGHFDTLQLYYDEKYTVDSLVGRVDFLGFRNPFKLEVTLNALIKEPDSKAFLQGKSDFEVAKETNRLKKIISNTMPINSVLDMESILDIIKGHLQLEQLDSDFSFALVNDQDIHLNYFSQIADSTSLMQSKFKTSVFTENPFVQNYFLLLYMPQVYEQNRIGWIQLLPLFIILFLLAALFLFTKQFFRQIHLGKLKSNFIHNIAHELNTPLANISLALETLEVEEVTKNQKTKILLNIISSESGRLHENIEKSLHFARMEGSDFRLQIENFDIVDLVNTVLISYRYKCQELGGEIYFDQTETIELFGDETHILNCIANILDNAVKYRSGKPIIYVFIRDMSDQVEIEIKDHGKGMNAITLKHIFDKFYRADEGDKHSTRGFGLGLSYVKSIMDLHEGRIDVQSKSGHGATFKLHFKKRELNG